MDSRNASISSEIAEIVRDELARWVHYRMAPATREKLEKAAVMLMAAAIASKALAGRIEKWGTP